MFGFAYRAIKENGDGSYKADGYLIMDRMHDGHGKVEIYGSDLVLKDSKYLELRKLSNGSYDMDECFPGDGRAYVLMDDRDMEDLLAMRKAIDRLNRLGSRQWTVGSREMDVSFCMESISGGKVHIADCRREGWVELRSEHSALVRHFVGAVNREGIRTPMYEPQHMSHETYERIGEELGEIAERYGFLCEKDHTGKWHLGIQEPPQEKREILCIREDKKSSDCIRLSEDVQLKMRAYLYAHPSFTQEGAWSFMDDLNGLCGRVTPSLIPYEDRKINTTGLQIGELFEKKDLSRLPHSQDAAPITAWDISQAILCGSGAMLRDCLIAFVRNLDNAALGHGEAVRFLGEMAVRHRLDTVRELNGDRLREMAKEALTRTGNHKETFTISKTFSYTGPEQLNKSRIMMVAEGDIDQRFRKTAVIER